MRKCRQSQIDAQIAVLNEDYAKVGVSWKHVNTTRIISADWYENISLGRYAQVAIPLMLQGLLLTAYFSNKANVLKQVFRKGGAASLNVFTVE